MQLHDDNFRSACYNVLCLLHVAFRSFHVSSCRVCVKELDMCNVQVLFTSEFSSSFAVVLSSNFKATLLLSVGI